MIGGILKTKLVSKRLGFGSGQGAGGLKSGAYTAVCEHFEPTRNAALGQKMSVLKRVLREGGAPVVSPFDILQNQGCLGSGDTVYFVNFIKN